MFSINPLQTPVYTALLFGSQRFAMAGISCSLIVRDGDVGISCSLI